MRSPRSLLYRLEFPEARQSRSIPGDPESVVDSIRQHLHLMFNTRQGNALTAPDFGTSDFTGLIQGFEAENKIADEIRHSIERYEPRLTDVRVRFDADKARQFNIHFDIYAAVQLKEGSRPTRFHSKVENNGEVTVQRK